MLSPFLEEKGPHHTVHPTSCPRPKQDVSTCQAGRFKNNGPTFRTQSGEETQFISRGAQEREQTRSSREGMHELWGAVSSARRRIQKSACFRETLGSSTLWPRPASGLGEAAGSVYTCHEGGGGRKKGSPSKAPNFSTAPGREGAARRGAVGRWQRRDRASRRRRPGR